ncbi:hypothetical protein [Leucobacter sp. PH1c]|uniref:hypothetical protein n=1 Tax=Leucobacter sp. PH1c TaxID=1397278 RepID=UPI0018E2E0FF|nr:hypothetical protein [Leucobacter sp. PH1c]
MIRKRLITLLAGAALISVGISGAGSTLSASPAQAGGGSASGQYGYKWGDICYPDCNGRWVYNVSAQVVWSEFWHNTAHHKTGVQADSRLRWARSGPWSWARVAMFRAPVQNYHFAKLT